jgi:hypothetical protein
MRLLLEHPDHLADPSEAYREEPEHDLCARIRAEYREMPGLTLTLLQASRLFSIEPARCARILGALVHAGDLVTDGRTFASPHGGRRSA